MVPTSWGSLRTECNRGGRLPVHAWHPVRLTKKQLLVFYQRTKSSCSRWRVRGLPLCSHRRAPGDSLETLDLDSRLAIGPKVALADDYRGQNNVRFVSMELGHRILETEEPQKPKISMSEGTVLPQLPGPRVVWTYQERMDSCSDSRLGSRHWLIAFPLGIPEHPGRGGPSSSTTSSKAPQFPGIPCFPTSTRLECPEGPAAPGPPSPT